jgi:hypothetical protein
MVIPVAVVAVITMACLDGEHQAASRIRCVFADGSVPCYCSDEFCHRRFNAAPDIPSLYDEAPDIPSLYDEAPDIPHRSAFFSTLVVTHPAPDSVLCHVMLAVISLQVVLRLGIIMIDNVNAMLKSIASVSQS